MNLKIKNYPTGRDKVVTRALLGAGGLAVAVGVVWATIAWHGRPDRMPADAGDVSGILDIGVLVFREGLESILVLAALTASMTGPRSVNRRAIAVGAGLGVFLTMLTWSGVIRLVDRLSDRVSALHLQAATGLVAIVVLLVVMNWFFHRVYWTGWIRLHTDRKKRLVARASRGGSHRRLAAGLLVLGLTSVYREGFEVVLFLQGYRLRLGDFPILWGVVTGCTLAGIVAVLTFAANRRLPFKRMLVFTGVTLAAVLLVMVGEQVQEMQQAGWLPTTPLASLQQMPDWLGLWFAVFPNVESLAAQALAAILVAGSYFLARLRTELSLRRGLASRVHGDA